MEPDAGDDGGERPARVDVDEGKGTGEWGETGGESITGVEKPDEDWVVINW